MLTERDHAVSRTTLVSDSAPPRPTPALAALRRGAVTGAEGAPHRLQPGDRTCGKGRGVRAEISPFAEDELESFYLAAGVRDQRLADVLLVAA
jgi:hypothetical protein